MRRPDLMRMMNDRRALRAGHEFRVGTREIVVLGLAFVLVWVLTFIFGVLIGREFASPGGGGRPAGAAVPAERAKSGTKTERAGTDDRLTFYQTLTAPTPDLPVVRPPTYEERITPRDAPAAPTRKAEPKPAAGGAAASAEPGGGPGSGPGRAPADAARPPAGGRRGAVGAPPAGPREPGVAAPGEPKLWTVQVSSFRSRALAEELRTRLVARGFDAYLVSVTTEEGRVRHRVRVGGFGTRAEAERVVAELRGERNLSPFVTTRAR